MSVWYHTDGGQQKGPVSEDELRRLASSGSLRPDDLVWTEGMAEWTPARDLEGITWPPPLPSGHSAAYRPSTRSGGPQQITNYLPWAIAATFLCCMPTGIVAIVYSSKAANAQSFGDYDAARKAADNARLWLIISVIACLVVAVVYIAGGCLGDS